MPCKNSIFSMFKGTCQGAGVLFVVLLAPSFASATEVVSPFAVLEDQWVTPDGYFEKEQPPKEVEVIEKVVPEEALPSLTPPLMPSTWNWKNVQEVKIEQAPVDFFDDAAHWKKLDDVKDQLDRFYETTLAQGDDGQSTATIRFSLLPHRDAQAVYDARISKSKSEAQAKLNEEKLAAQKNAELKATSEACEALSKAKKKQLEAIESDRRTLMALREAMKDLGLVKKLAFMTDGAQSVPAEQGGVKPDDSVSQEP